MIFKAKRKRENEKESKSERLEEREDFKEKKLLQNSWNLSFLLQIFKMKDRLMKWKIKMRTWWRRKEKRMVLKNFKRKTNYSRKYLELVKRKAAVYNAVKERKIMEREKERCTLIHFPMLTHFQHANRRGW